MAKRLIKSVIDPRLAIVTSAPLGVLGSRSFIRPRPLASPGPVSRKTIECACDLVSLASEIAEHHGFIPDCPTDHALDHVIEFDSSWAMISLNKVTSDNWRACIRLEMHEHQQGFVPNNVATIAESRFESHFVLRAINSVDKVVGMLAYCPEDDPPDPTLYWIFRLMIDKHHQNQGIGTVAMRLAIDEIRELGAHRVRTMHKPANTIASALYQKLGFREIGFHDDGDVLLELELR